MALTIINAALVRQLLTMSECIDAMVPAMIAVSRGTVVVPPRMNIPLLDDSGFFLLMPGASQETGSYGAKLISLHPRNPEKGLPAIQGFVALFDRTTGAPMAIIEGAEVTAIRTAAASGLATRLLAREDAASCGIFGTGVQAITHIDAMCAVRPIEEIIVWGRNFEKAEHFASEQAQRTGINIVATELPAAAAACDLVCTVTGSPEPILKGEWVKSGAHVNLVGSHTLATREAETDLIVKSRLYVDLLESCRNEGGDIMIPVQEGAISEADIVGEIGQLLNGDIEGRTADNQITLYKSLGITAQDLFAASRVFDKALAENLGVTAEL